MPRVRSNSRLGPPLKAPVFRLPEKTQMAECTAEAVEKHATTMEAREAAYAGGFAAYCLPLTQAAPNHRGDSQVQIVRQTGNAGRRLLLQLPLVTLPRLPSFAMTLSGIAAFSEPGVGAG